MCGRYTITTKQGMLEERFDAEAVEDIAPRYNAAPSQKLPVILNTDPKKIQLIKWGLMPPWVKKMGRREIINVRDDTIRNKPTFKADVKNRRCLVLADGFYEWQLKNGFKQPFRITLKDNSPFALAGIWEVNHPDEKTEVTTFAIITTTPNKVMTPIHDRMPVILSRKEEAQWLADGQISLLDSFPDTEIMAYPVSSLVNKPAFDRPEAIVSIARSK